MMELILLLDRSPEDLERHLEHLEKEGFISPTGARAGGDFFAALLSYDITGEGRRERGASFWQTSTTSTTTSRSSSFR